MADGNAEAWRRANGARDGAAASVLVSALLILGCQAGDPPSFVDAGFVDTAVEDDAVVLVDDGGAFEDSGPEPCVTGEYRMQGTPIAAAPISLSYEDSSGWIDVFLGADDVYHMQRIANDLDSIAVGPVLADDGVIDSDSTFRLAPTDAVNPANGNRLVLIEPQAPSLERRSITHCMAPTVHPEPRPFT